MKPNSSRPARAAVVAIRRWIGFAGIGALVLLSACGKSEPPAPSPAQPSGPSNPAAMAMPVTAIRVTPQQVPIVIEAVGQAEGSREVEVRARVSGILEKRLYNEGDAVRAGTVLFQIDRIPYELALAQARAALGEIRAKQEQAQRESDRLKDLSDQRAISRKEYDDATSAVKQTASSIAGAEARVREAELNLSYTTVKAQINGITGRALRSEGSLVTAGTDSSLLTTITQVNPIWVRFSLAAADADRVRESAKRARVNIVRQDGKVEATGRLNFTASTVDPKLGTVQLRAEFTNPSQEWMPGQFARVQVLAGEQEAFLVPQSAVVQTEQARMVWVVGPDGKAVMRPVQTANWIGSDWVVTGGLSAGDQIIVDNLIKLRPGAPVQPHPPGAAPGGGAPAGAPGGAGAPSGGAGSSIGTPPTNAPSSGAKKS